MIRACGLGRLTRAGTKSNMAVSWDNQNAARRGRWLNTIGIPAGPAVSVCRAAVTGEDIRRRAREYAPSSSPMPTTYDAGPTIRAAGRVVGTLRSTLRSALLPTTAGT